jgi:hypothetical protein
MALTGVVLVAGLSFVYAWLGVMMAYLKYYTADLSLDYQARRRLVSTYAHLREDQHSDPWLTDEEKKTFTYFPELNRADRLMALSFAAVVAARATVGIATHFLEK